MSDFMAMRKRVDTYICISMCIYPGEPVGAQSCYNINAKRLARYYR